MYLVGITVVVLLTVVAVGLTEVNSDNWSPFFPEQWSGVREAAAIIFFAYIGFDIVATTAEETKNPGRDMPIGIVGSLVIVTLLYMGVAAVVTGMVPAAELAESDAPVAGAFAGKGLDVVETIIYAGALVAILNTVMVLMLGQSRVGFAMSRDQLLPSMLGRTTKWGTPYGTTLVTIGVVAILAAFVPLSDLAELVNIGTLFAFFLVALGVLILRFVEPERERPFRTPLAYVTAPLAMAGCIYLATDLPIETWVRFFVWMAVGLVVYFAYSVRASRVGAARKPSRTDG
jgi:APA family basic amino acid/polyamine antiporter